MTCGGERLLAAAATRETLAASSPVRRLPADQPPHPAASDHADAARPPRQHSAVPDSLLHEPSVYAMTVSEPPLIVDDSLRDSSCLTRFNFEVPLPVDCWRLFDAELFQVFVDLAALPSAADLQETSRTCCSSVQSSSHGGRFYRD